MAHHPATAETYRSGGGLRVWWDAMAILNFLNFATRRMAVAGAGPTALFPSSS